MGYEKISGTTGQVHRLLAVCEGALSRNERQERMGLGHRDSFNKAYLLPALEAGCFEMTIPDKPRISKQQYRLTAQGRTLLESLPRLDPDKVSKKVRVQLKFIKV